MVDRTVTPILSLSRLLFVTIALLVTSVGAAIAQSTVKPPRPIQDNSFLVEEAYNQEKGVVQHIGVFERVRDGGSTFEFTQEWPVRGLKHQLSYSVPYQLTGERGIGDVMVNYRYQLRGDGDSIIALAPRFSVVIPTDHIRGIELSIPASVWIARQFITHSNLTLNLSEDNRVKSVEVDGETTSDLQPVATVTIGQSAIWLLHPNLNLMLEALWETTNGPARTSPSVSRTTISPGVRGAINLKSGMQIVPGLAVPISNDGSRSILVYLSVEHDF